MSAYCFGLGKIELGLVGIILIFPSLLLACTIYLGCLESPIFFICKKEIEKAKSVLQLTTEKDDTNINQSIEKITQKFIQSEEQEMSLMSIFKRSEVFEPFCLLMCLSFLQQFGCMAIFRNNVIEIFKEIFTNSNSTQTRSDKVQVQNNCSDNSAVYLAGVIVGVVRFAGSFVPPLIINHHRRRRIFFGSGTYQKNFAIFLSHFNMINFRCHYCNNPFLSWSLHLSQ